MHERTLQNQMKGFRLLIKVPTKQSLALLSVAILSSLSLWYSKLTVTSFSTTQSSTYRGPPLCTLEELKLGEWIPARYDRPPYIPGKHRKCKDFNETGPFETWHWTPRPTEGECGFSRFSEKSFCQIAVNRTIAIVGDSINFDIYLSLSNLLGVNRDVPRAKLKSAVLTSRVCENRTLLIGKRDFHLLNLRSFVNEYSPNILVLNRGAHYVNDKQLVKELGETTIPQLRSWMRSCQDSNRDCQLFWRTSYPGHPNCSKFHQPVSNIQAMEELVATDPNGYYWDAFPKQSPLVHELLVNASIPHYWLDVYPIMIQRPDIHNPPDCLHACLPKENTLSELVLHALKVTKTSESSSIDIS